MSLQAQQAFWARFYTDPELRRRAAHSPETVAAEFRIGLQVVTDTLQSTQPGMEVFTQALVRKRYKQCTALLPLTAEAHREKFREAFSNYAEKHPVPDIYRYESDALAFAGHLRPELQPLWQDLLRFECMLASCQAREPRIRIALFCYPVHKMAAQLRRQQILNQTGRRPTLVLSWRSRDGQQMRGFHL
jgi:hypothetical protein